jgi:hypothetical protein
MQTGSTLSATVVGTAAEVAVVVDESVELGATAKSSAARMIVNMGGFLQRVPPDNRRAAFSGSDQD